MGIILKLVVLHILKFSLPSSFFFKFANIKIIVSNQNRILSQMIHQMISVKIEHWVWKCRKLTDFSDCDRQ